MKKDKLMIDMLGDGVYIEVPVPIGSCGTCKYRNLQIFIGDQYIHQPMHGRCNECNIANGMEMFESTIIDWSKITELTEKHNILQDKYKDKWVSKKYCGW